MCGVSFFTALPSEKAPLLPLFILPPYIIQYSSDSYYFSYSAAASRRVFFGNVGGKCPCPVYIEERLPQRWPSVRRCWQQRPRVNRHMDKGAKNWKTMNQTLFYAASTLPVFCHRTQGIVTADGLHDRHGGMA